MGFYGNITDTAKTQFQFDIIYPNRKAMDNAIHNESNNTDGVHIGRFVLVSYGDIENPEYNTNFNIDADEYGTRRGYDGTVWQKIFVNNTENYIMIAELNTIVPQFDIGAADAPSMVPLIPHFGSDSSNIYYKLHWSPTWGFRVKAANANLCGPELNDDGSSTSNYVPMSADDKHYLSDENTLWHNRIGENTYVFDQNDEDVNQGIWTTDDDVNGIPAAIYYNKAGFNPAVISYGYNEVNLTAETYIPNHYYVLNNGVYEKDLSNTLGEGPYYEKIDDHILIEPTGYSGHSYNIENEEHAVSGSTTKVDTQELSIMLPTLGNTIAAIWDLIYGDRVVNNGDYRNLDIAWESARESLQRKGLRLVQDFDGTYHYKTKNVDTIAGAINSVHDLMGMIIISDTEQNLNDQIDTLSEDRIYYDQTNGTFKRKCRGYEYTEIDDTDSEVYSFVPVEVEFEDYQAGMYYIENNNGYILATGAFNNSNQYYLRSLQVDSQYSLVEDITDDFNGLNFAYKEYFGKPGFYDYIRNEKYYNDKDYYTWTSVRQAMTESPLTDEYEANKFYYFDGNGFYLDAGEKPTIGRTYYQYKKENSHTVASLNKDGIYMANKYAYATDEGYEIDSSSTMGEGPYFELIPQETTVTETIYIKEEIYEAVVFDENTQYAPHVYYIKVGTNEYDGPRTENTPQEGVTYYRRKVTYKRVDNQTKQFTVDASNPLENLIQFHTNEFYKKQGNNFIKIQDVADLENQDKFSIYVLRKDTDRTGNESNGGTYILNDVDFDNENESAMLRVTHAFYQPNIYYYQTVENPGNNEYSSYLLDVYPNKTVNRTYYSFDSRQLVEANLDNVFEPYKYYLKTAEDRYELILTPTRPRDNQNQLLPFYERNQTYYVVHDDANIYKHGSIWNYGITYVPSSVTLATREEGWQFKELKGFARDITTMHGLILKIKTLLDSDNEDTRDLDTVKGALNTLNDKIAKLDTWGSGQFIIVDDYGRLHGAEIIGQDGIKAEVDSNINNPRVVFSANFDGEEGINASSIKLRNYELDEENTGNIEAMDSLEVALNKVENKNISQQQNFDDLVNWTETVIETTPGSETEIGLARAEFWRLYNTLHSHTVNEREIAYFGSLPGLDIEDSSSFAEARILIAHANDIEASSVPMYYFDDNTGSYVAAMRYVAGYSYLTLKDYVIQYLYSLDDRYATFYEQGRNYQDPDIINQTENSYAFKNLIEDFPKAPFNFDTGSDIPYDETIQSFWNSYQDFMETIQFTRGYDTINLLCYKPIETLAEEDFQLNTYYYFVDWFECGTMELATNYEAEKANEYYIVDQEYPFIIDYPALDSGYLKIQFPETIEPRQAYIAFWNWLGQTIYYYDNDLHDYRLTTVENYNSKGDLFINWLSYLKKQTFFDQSILNNTSEKAFKYVGEITATQFRPRTYYILDDGYYFIQHNYTENQNYYKLKLPVLEQEGEKITTSLATLWNTFFPVGSTYTTATNNPPEFGGEWELIDKRFKYMTVDNLQENNSSFVINEGIRWSDTNTQDYDLTDPDAIEGQGGPRYIKLVRSDHHIMGTLYWCNKIAYNDTNLLICTLAFNELGLDKDKFYTQDSIVYGYRDKTYLIGAADGLDATLICYFVKRENTGSGENYRLALCFNDVIYKTAQVTTINHPCYVSFNLLIDKDQMLDSACDQFIWKRIS